MDKRLTQEQLTRIVGEVERLSQQRLDEVDRQQMEQILEELSLPPDLLDEAMTQVQRRDALTVQQRQQRNLFIGVVAGLIVAVAAGAFWWQQDQQTFARVSAQQDRLSLISNKAVAVKTVSRPADVIYTVTLKDAPVGKTLKLTCDWIALGDQVLKQNSYATQEITTPVWDTHCKTKINTTDPTGNWRVRMLLNGRQLSETAFEVK